MNSGWVGWAEHKGKLLHTAGWCHTLQSTQQAHSALVQYLGGILLCKEGRLREAPAAAVNKGGPVAVGLCLEAVAGTAGGPAATGAGFGELDGMEMPRERGLAGAAAPAGCATV